MNKRQKLEQIFELLARISVAGDAVDIMAAVRGELRSLHREVRAEEIAAQKAALDKSLEDDKTDLDGTDEEVADA